MIYKHREWVDAQAWRPLPPRHITHFIFMEADQDIDSVYRPMGGRLYEIKDEVREWLWFHADHQTTPFERWAPKFDHERQWGYDLAVKGDHQLGLKGYVAFADKDIAMLFKLTWQ